MKNKIINLGLVLLLITGVVILSYPFLSNFLHEKKQDKIVTEYKSTVENMGKERKKELLMEAEEYNSKLSESAVLTDPFDPSVLQKQNEAYYQILNENSDGIMGYIEIPRIRCYEAIYHGTDEETLQKGIGHLANTSFPIGGNSTHAVLSGHTGLMDAELFTNLSQMKKDDIFYIHILDDVLAYRVDQIKVVLPTETEDLKIVSGKDYVTLVTCTPYGINSHRLLVRGTRVENDKKIKRQADEQKAEGMDEEEWKSIYKKAFIEGTVVAICTLGMLFLIIKKRRKDCK